MQKQHGMLQIIDARVRLGKLLHNINHRIYHPLVAIIRKGRQELTSLQLVALLRIRWTINAFRRKNSKGMLNEIEEMEETYDQEILPFYGVAHTEHSQLFFSS